MRELLPIISAAILLVFAVSCSKDTTTVSTVSVSNVRDDSFKVSPDELLTYLGMDKDPITRSSSYSIEPLPFRGDTVLYLARSAKGWRLFSADKRTCPVLAYSDEEPWSDELFNKNPAFAKWYEAQCKAVHLLRNGASQTSTIDAFWEHLTKQKEEVRSGPGSPEGPGWRHIHTFDSLVVYDDITPIIYTKWGQWEPWNNCSPFVGSTPNMRCAVGCVNIAFGQVLYWAHSNWGIPQYMYTMAFCNDTVHNSNVYQACTISFIDSSAVGWSQMRLRSNMSGNADYSGNLMAKVSRFNNSGYGWKYNEDLSIFRETASNFDSVVVDSISSYFGLTASFSGYDKSSVVNSLRDGSPVIIGSHVHPSSTIGHVWIIDGYTHTYELIRRYYIWDPENSYNPGDGYDDEEEEDPGEGISYGPDTFVVPEGYLYQITEIPFTEEYYRMNWGYDGVGDGVYYNVNSYGWSWEGGSPFLSSLATIAYSFSPVEL